MKKMFLLLIILIATIAVGCFFIFYKKTTKVCFSDNCFEVEIADNFANRAIGLMYRRNLDQNKGMLFIFSKEGIYSFWMKNTLIPLDIVWMDKDGRIVLVSENVQPCSKGSCIPITPNQKAKYVLEINSGEAKRIQMKIGDKMEMK